MLMELWTPTTMVLIQDSMPGMTRYCPFEIDCLKKYFRHLNRWYEHFPRDQVKHHPQHQPQQQPDPRRQWGPTDKDAMEGGRRR